MDRNLRVVDELLQKFARRRPARAGSLIITVFGDSISQHGNSAGLVSLITALEPFGLNARQIRTAVFRLVKDNWLEAKHRGRHSFYSLTRTGLGHYTRAARRIYAAGRPLWDGKWTLVIPSGVPPHDREALKRELVWLGYGAVSPGLYAHPTGDHRSLDEMLGERKLLDRVVVLSARTLESESASGIRELCRESWGLDQIAARYEAFLRMFRPAARYVRRVREPDPGQCFKLRTLLIHEYRRILLHDTDLPDELLPPGWPGREAQALTAALYRQVQRGAVEFVRRGMNSVTGPLPAPSVDYFRRFGGLN